MTKKAEPTNGTGEKLAPNQIKLAEGTEFEKVITLKVLRGKKHRANHLKLLETFSELEEVSTAMQEGGSKFKVMLGAIQKLFGQEKFEEEMLPFSLGMETDEECEWLEKLTPMEQFLAYMQGAAYIVNGAEAEGVQAALKK